MSKDKFNLNANNSLTPPTAEGQGIADVTKPKPKTKNEKAKARKRKKAKDDATYRPMHNLRAKRDDWDGVGGSGGKVKHEASQLKTNNPTGLANTPTVKKMLSLEFVDALSYDFGRHGLDAIQRVREESPAEYLRIIVAAMPKKVAIEHTIVDDLKELSDDELDRRIAGYESESGEGDVVEGEVETQS